MRHLGLYSRAALFRRVIHAAEKNLPAWIGMQTLKARIFLEANKGMTSFLHRFLQNPECLIPVAERRVNSGGTNRVRLHTPDHLPRFTLSAHQGIDVRDAG